ncbi:hypothetical protein AQJ11_44860 [Streptomyces corchorusii]|uniref:Uncharacterized protein n=1 Tax=Streptomyces corchorusii TaxID=1903 RepID=A0A101PKU0_STRCK|nr:hypothetical protein AQJ11_44860 [Streptomyces corchorusii]
MLQRRQLRQCLEQRGCLEVHRAVDVGFHRPGVDPAGRRVERPVVVHLRITGQQLGGVQQEGDVQRMERFVLRHAA